MCTVSPPAFACAYILRSSTARRPPPQGRYPRRCTACRSADVRPRPRPPRPTIDEPLFDILPSCGPLSRLHLACLNSLGSLAISDHSGRVLAGPGRRRDGAAERDRLASLPAQHRTAHITCIEPPVGEMGIPGSSSWAGRCCRTPDSLAREIKWRQPRRRTDHTPVQHRPAGAQSAS